MNCDKLQELLNANRNNKIVKEILQRISMYAKVSHNSRRYYNATRELEEYLKSL